MGMEINDYDNVDETKQEDEESLDETPIEIDLSKEQSVDTAVGGDIRVVGDTNDVKQLDAAVQELERTETGQELASAIRENDVSIKFGEVAVAKYDHTSREITISEDYRDADPLVLAAHLAHEGTHAQWFGQGLSDSIDQEFHAFKNQKEIWDSIKGDKTDKQCDGVSEFMSQDEADVKLLLRQMESYSNLPEYS